MSDLDLTLRRQPTFKRVTFGSLYDEDGGWICFTLEDEVRFGQKVPGSTAIPEGRYRLTLEDSPKFGPNTITVNDVPGFSFIRIHAGNTHEDTDGCPLVGLRKVVDPIGSGGYLLDSRMALRELKDIVRPVVDGGGEVWLTIYNLGED